MPEDTRDDPKPDMEFRQQKLSIVIKILSAVHTAVAVADGPDSAASQAAVKELAGLLKTIEDNPKRKVSDTLLYMISDTSQLPQKVKTALEKIVNMPSDEPDMKKLLDYTGKAVQGLLKSDVVKANPVSSATSGSRTDPVAVGRSRERPYERSTLDVAAVLKEIEQKTVERESFATEKKALLDYLRQSGIKNPERLCLLSSAAMGALGEASDRLRRPNEGDPGLYLFFSNTAVSSDQKSPNLIMYYMPQPDNNRQAHLARLEADLGMGKSHPVTPAPKVFTLETRKDGKTQYVSAQGVELASVVRELQAKEKGYSEFISMAKRDIAEKKAGSAAAKEEPAPPPRPSRR